MKKFNVLFYINLLSFYFIYFVFRSFIYKYFYIIIHQVLTQIPCLKLNAISIK